MIKKHLLIFSAISLLTGCILDSDTDLAINSYSPQNESNNAAVDTTIRVQLNSSLNTSTLNDEHISLTSSTTGKAINGELSYDSSTKEIVFQPSHKLAVNTEYTVSLQAGLSGETGATTGALDWSFTTNNNYQFKLLNIEEACADACGNELWLIAEGGEVREIADINPMGSSNPSTNMVQYKGLFYLSADDGTHGPEIWVSDGTESHTELFADIIPGSTGSNPSEFTIFGDYLYFVANNGTNYGTLWKTDGTAAGTEEVVNPRPNGNPSIGSLKAIGEQLFFTAYDDNTGGEIYVSDGTAAGTRLVTDLAAGTTSSGAEFLFALNDELYFHGSDGNDTDTNPEHHSYSLFKTDGTAQGTVLVKDINPTENSSSESRIQLLNQLGDKYLFLANDGTNGSQLWVTDGTENGTQLVKVLNAGGISVRTMTVFNNKLFIAERNTGLWESDGTEQGTVLVKSFDYILDLRTSDNGLIVSARDSSGLSGYWLSDGTDAGTELFHERANGNLWLGTQIGNGTMFYENNGVDIFHYYTDGTVQGTNILETPNGLNLIYSDL